MKKSIEQIRAELDAYNERARKTQSISDNQIIGRAKQAKKLTGKTRPDQKQMMLENNPMKGKVSPNRGKEMPQISEKVKGKPKHTPESKAKISQSRKGNIPWSKGKKRPEHSERMKKDNPGLEKTRQPWICEHCGKQGVGSSNYVRWHGDNCKLK